MCNIIIIYKVIFRILIDDKEFNETDQTSGECGFQYRLHIEW